MIRIICICVSLISLPAIAATHHAYTVSLDATLDVLRVNARFATPVHRLAPRNRDASRYLSQATDCDSGKQLRSDGRRLILPRSGIRCLQYTIDLARIASNDRRNAALATSNIVVSPADWLWRPRLDRGHVLDIEFDTVVNVSVPWEPLGDKRFRLDASPQSGKAVSAFGAFRSAEHVVGGSTLRLALLQPKGGFDYTDIERWLVDTAANIALGYGRFPNPSPQVLLIPGSRGSSPVPFGRVVRDGGEAVELFVNVRRPISEFYDDWTATHEFSHLMLPYVTIRQRWVSEGFAQYYQNVLLARAGIYDQQRAWQKLYEGLERGRRSRPELSPNAASARGIRAALMKVYWSGASILLMADVELRQRSGNAETLDVVLDRLQQCCLPSDRVWTAAELFAALDEQLDEPLFMPLYERYADAPGFPDYRPVFESLGLDIVRGRVVLDEDAELAALRNAIVTPSASSYAPFSRARVPAVPRKASAPAAP